MYVLVKHIFPKGDNTNDLYLVLANHYPDGVGTCSLNEYKEEFFAIKDGEGNHYVDPIIYDTLVDATKGIERYLKTRFDGTMPENTTLKMYQVHEYLMDATVSRIRGDNGSYYQSTEVILKKWGENVRGR